MDIRYNYIFLVDKEKGKTDGKLRLRVKWGSNIVAFGLGYRVDIDKWSREVQRCKNNTTHGNKKVMASVINRAIQKWEEVVRGVFINFEKNNIIPTVEQVRIAVNVEMGRAEDIKQNDIFEVLMKFTDTCGTLNNWSISTYKKFKTLRNQLLEIDSNVSFEYFNEEGLNKYVEFLLKDKYMRNSTISRQLKILKWFLRWAYDNGYSKTDDFRMFTPKMKSSEKQIVFLDWEELMHVYRFDFPTSKPSLSAVRDVFCFCCFTSLRYSDVANLKRNDVKSTYIEVTTIKTGDKLRIELNDYSRAILERYKGEEFRGNLALPVISNQRMNEHLKELGQICGLDTPVRDTYYKGNERIDDIYPKWVLLTTHAARRTFICNALMLGIPANVVMKWTGHSDYKAMRPYIDVADKAKEEAMRLFNKK